MSTFAEKEDKEERYAWKAFKKWLDRGKWRCRRFRYAKDITDFEIEQLPVSKMDKIRIKALFAKIDFKFDGIMSRGPELKRPVEKWLFDLKYKRKASWKTWVNRDSYQAYYELSNTIPFIMVVYVHEEDSLYFHRIRNPSDEPKPKRFLKGGKWLYAMPESEYYLIKRFDVPWECPKTLVDYYALCWKIEDLYMAMKEGRPPKERNHALEAIEAFKRGYPEAWSKVPFMDIEEIPPSSWKNIWDIIRQRKKAGSI